MKTSAMTCRMALLTEAPPQTRMRDSGPTEKKERDCWRWRERRRRQLLEARKKKRSLGLISAPAVGFCGGAKLGGSRREGNGVELATTARRAFTAPV